MVKQRCCRCALPFTVSKIHGVIGVYCYKFLSGGKSLCLSSEISASSLWSWARQAAVLNWIVLLHTAQLQIQKAAEVRCERQSIFPPIPDVSRAMCVSDSVTARSAMGVLLSLLCHFCISMALYLITSLSPVNAVNKRVWSSFAEWSVISACVHCSTPLAKQNKLLHTPCLGGGAASACRNAIEISFPLY